MNAPASINTLRHRTAVMQADAKRNERIAARADELVNKSMPRRNEPVPYGFYAFKEAIERAAYKGKRDRLLKMATTELHCLDYALEYWQADYEAAYAALCPSKLAEDRVNDRAQAMADRSDALAKMEARKVKFLADRAARYEGQRWNNARRNANGSR